jgi:hypothetical protein
MLTTLSGLQSPRMKAMPTGASVRAVDAPHAARRERSECRGGRDRCTVDEERGQRVPLARRRTARSGRADARLERNAHDVPVCSFGRLELACDFQDRSSALHAGDQNSAADRGAVRGRDLAVHGRVRQRNFSAESRERDSGEAKTEQQVLDVGFHGFHGSSPS